MALIVRPLSGVIFAALAWAAIVAVFRATFA
jgi:hypothetical protein